MVASFTLGGGFFLYRANRPPTLTIPKDQAVSSNDSEKIHVRGNPTAPVTLEEFGDFECPPCGHVAGALKEIEREFGNRLRVIFYNFPLITHAHSREAAYAAEAANLQGHFWEMHDLLFKEQTSWSKATDVRPLFVAYASLLGLDAKRFANDMESEQAKERVDSDVKRGDTLGVTNTPTIFINNTALPAAALNPIALRAAIEKAAATTKSSP